MKIFLLKNKILHGIQNKSFAFLELITKTKTIKLFPMGLFKLLLKIVLTDPEYVEYCALKLHVNRCCIKGLTTPKR